MTASEFDVSQSWQADRRGPLRWILSHTLRHKLVILGLFVGALGNAVMASVMPVFVGRAFDAVLEAPPDLRGLAMAAIVVVASQLVRGVLQLGRNWSAETLGQRLERDIRDELYVSLLGKSMSFHDMQPTGDLMARATNDVREINFLFNPGLNMVVGSLMFLLVPFYFVPTLHPQLVLVPLVYLLVYFFVVRSYLRELRPTTEGVRREFGRMNTRLAEAIEGIETVKGAAQEQREIALFFRAISGWHDAYLTQTRVEARFVPLLLLGFLQAGGLLYSLLLLRAGEIGVGDVAAFNGILQMFRFPTFAAQFAYTRVSSGIASARRILDLINARTELDQNVAGHDAPLLGEVAFENVTFCYQAPYQYCSVEDEETVLEGVSFRVTPGQTVAIVGQTGSGKSTIAKLINRTYDVDEGRILVDGVDVRDWNMESLRRQISVIEQDIFLFSRTIAENIAFGRPDTTPEEIEAAARAAQAHDFIVGFKDGYDAVIGERGVTLSGGQRQRLALARAFLTRPPILILDDATSAIDSETEDRIQRAIERAAAGRTTFLITHRLSQIRWADLIIVMRGGRVEAVGTHEELLQDSAAYRNIFMRYER
jgi:ATP-binding cassette, subfamily B, bacterial